MGHLIDYHADNKIIFVQHKGRLNFKTAEEYSSEAVKLARQNDCHRFLIDHSQTIVQENQYKLHTGGEELEQFGFSNTDRIAVVITQDKDSLNLTESEDHYSHASMIQYFDKPDAAVEWLVSEE